MTTAPDVAPIPHGTPDEGRPPLGAVELERAVQALRGMAYEHRLHILVLLRAGGATPSLLAERIPANPTAVAHHLRHLMDAGLVGRRRQGRQVFYTLAGEETARLVDEVLRFTASRQPGR